ncbi:hypothetical protein HDZ31DRAFT_76612 [Schizophyllum fasciatum]
MSAELPPARIRPLSSDDPEERKTVMRLVAKHEMEALARANRRAYTNPALLLLWLTISSAFVEYMQWWPHQQPATLGGVWSWLSPTHGYAPFLVVLLVAVDWFNRSHFEDHMQATLRAEDMHDLLSYYAQPPGSAFWLLEYDGDIIGLVAVKVQESPDGQAASAFGVITHFTVIELYRPAGVQRDLLQHALRKTFEANDRVAFVQTEEVALHPYIQQALREEGFRATDGDAVRTMGFMRWKVRNSVMTRDQWKKRQGN